MNQKDVDEIKKKLPKYGDRVKNSSSGRIIFDSDIMVEYSSGINLMNYKNYDCIPYLITKPIHIKVRIVFRKSNDTYKTINIKLSNDTQVQLFIDNLTILQRYQL